MNRIVIRRSGWFLAFAWVFLAALFADSANLDDLFTSNYVLHDDDEVGAEMLPPPTSIPADTPAQKPSSASQHPVRVVVDQDSPSLAAEYDASALVSEAWIVETPGVTYETPRTADCLHIKYRTLLI